MEMPVNNMQLSIHFHQITLTSYIHIRFLTELVKSTLLLQNWLGSRDHYSLSKNLNLTTDTRKFHLPLYNQIQLHKRGHFLHQIP